MFLLLSHPSSAGNIGAAVCHPDHRTIKHDRSWASTHGEGPKQSAVAWSILFLLLIPIQWFLMGAFPLVQSKHRLLEPGAFITLCAALGAVLALFPWLESLPEGPAALAGIMWFFWFGWLIWKAVRFIWRSALRLLPRPAH